MNLEIRVDHLDRDCMYLLIQYQMSKKEREICQFEMDLKNFLLAL